MKLHSYQLAWPIKTLKMFNKNCKKQDILRSFRILLRLVPVCSQKGQGNWQVPLFFDIVIYLLFFLCFESLSFQNFKLEYFFIKFTFYSFNTPPFFLLRFMCFLKNLLNPIRVVNIILVSFYWLLMNVIFVEASER